MNLLKLLSCQLMYVQSSTLYIYDEHGYLPDGREKMKVFKYVGKITVNPFCEIYCFPRRAFSKATPGERD